MICSIAVSPRRLSLFLLVAALLVFTGCGDDLRTAPSSSLAGLWAGTMTDNNAGQGTVLLNLSESPGSVSGFLVARFSSGDISGPVAGSVNGSSLTLETEANLSNCSLQVTATIDGDRIADRIAGSYTVFGCADFSAGNIDLSRSLGE